MNLLDTDTDICYTLNMNKETKLVRANYRITSKQFNWVKSQASKKKLGEAEFVRSLLQTLMNK